MSDATSGPEPEPTTWPEPVGAPAAGPASASGRGGPEGPRTSSRIRRDTRDGIIGGVAAGFARHLDVDVVWIRLAFVLLTVFGGGLGLVAYLAAWLIVPEGDASDLAAPSRGRDRSLGGRGAAFWTGVALVALGAIILLDTILSPLTARLAWASTGDLLVPLVLISIGALIYRSSRDGRAAPTDASGATQETADLGGAGDDAESRSARLEQRVEQWGAEVERVAEGWEARIESHAAALREARSRARVAPITFGAAFIVLGGLWLARSLGVDGITPTRALAAVLLAIGAGLLVGAFRGRGRGLIVAGALLTPVVVLLTLVPQIPGGLDVVSVGRDGMIVGESERRIERPETLTALPESYEFGAGSLVIDLRALGEEIATAGTVRLDVSMGVGDLRVHLPEDVAADVSVELGIGRVGIAGSESGGLGVAQQQRIAASDGTPGLLVLRIEQGIGNVTVTR